LPVWISDVFFTLWLYQFVERVRLTLFRKKQFTKVKKKIMPLVLKEEVCRYPLNGIHLKGLFPRAKEEKL